MLRAAVVFTGAVSASRSPRFAPVVDHGAPKIASAAFRSASDSALSATVAAPPEVQEEPDGGGPGKGKGPDKGPDKGKGKGRG